MSTLTLSEFARDAAEDYMPSDQHGLTYARWIEIYWNIGTSDGASAAHLKPYRAAFLEEARKYREGRT